MTFSKIWGERPGNRQMRNRLNWLEAEIVEKNRNRQMRNRLNWLEAEIVEKNRNRRFDDYTKYQEEHNTSMFPDLEHIINGKEII